jgi:hypothetical protein
MSALNPACQAAHLLCFYDAAAAVQQNVITAYLHHPEHHQEHHTEHHTEHHLGQHPPTTAYLHQRVGHVTQHKLHCYRGPL